MSIKANFNDDIRRFALATNTFGELNDKIKATYRVLVPRITWRDSDGDTVTIASDDDLREALGASPQPLRVTVIENATVFPNAVPLPVAAAPVVVTPTPSEPRSIPVASSLPSTPVIVTPTTTAPSLAVPFTVTAMDLGGDVPVLELEVELVENEDDEQDTFAAATAAAAAAAAHDAEEEEGETGPVEHTGVQCDGCHGVVVGRRYKCRVCPDFDLCQTCEAAGLHPEHPMVRFCQPVRIPWGWGFGGHHPHHHGGFHRRWFGPFGGPNAGPAGSTGGPCAAGKPAGGCCGGAAASSDQQQQQQQQQQQGGGCPMRGFRGCGGPARGGWGHPHGPHHGHHHGGQGPHHGPQGPFGPHGGRFAFRHGGFHPFGSPFAGHPADVRGRADEAARPVPDAPASHTGANGAGDAAVPPVHAGAARCGGSPHPARTAASADDTSYPHDIADVLRDMGFQLDDATVVELMRHFHNHLGNIIAHLCAQ